MSIIINEDVDIDMSNLKVVSVSGKEIPRTNAIRIKGRWYERNVDCFMIPNIGNKIGKNGKDYMWHIKNNGIIDLDFEKNEYRRISDMLKEGKVKGYINKKLDVAYFTINPNYSVLIKESLGDPGLYCLNKELIENNPKFVEDLVTGIYYVKDNINSSLLKNITKKRIDHNQYPEGLTYNADPNNILYLKIIEEHTKYKNSMKPSKNVKIIANNLLENYSFGVEFETINGTIPKNLCSMYGIVPLRDGSLKGPYGEGIEFTTVPLSGAVGLEILKNQTYELSKRCEISHNCSMHLHISGIPKTRYNAMAVYKLFYLLEEEFFGLVQPYKENPGKLCSDWKKFSSDIRDNYCSKLPKFSFLNKTVSESEAINYFKDLFIFLADHSEITKESSIYNFEAYVHPKNRKWLINSRYYWVNFVPFVFNRSETIEMRLHTPTLNFTKTSCWLFINLAVLKFAENNANLILNKDFNKITLEDVVKGYLTDFGNTKLSRTEEENLIIKDFVDYLLAYINNRKELYFSNKEKKLYYDKKEFVDDNTFSLKHKRMNSLY